MSDILQTILDGVSKRLKDMGDGTYAEVVYNVNGGGGGGGIADTVAIDQTIPGTTNAVRAANFPATVDTNSGNKSASTLRVVLATDQPQISNALKVDGSAVTQPVSGTVTANPTSSTPVLQAGLSTTVQTVAAAAAVLDSYYIYNPNSSVAYVQIFDISGTVTLGTSIPKWSIGVPPTSGANLSGLKLAFANAIKVAATTTATGSSAPTTALDCSFGTR